MLPRPFLLVVENDPAVCEAVAMAVSHLGYEVILAASGTGEEALAIMARAAALDALYTDIRLAGRVDGWTVGRAFSSLWPNKPIAYALASAPERDRPLGPGVFLRKPFDMHELEDVFRRRRR
jgi:two-component system OmpR family response regulator